MVAVGVITLGASPLFGNFAQSITLQDFTNAAWNGYYVQVGEVATPTNVTRTFQRYTAGTNSVFYCTLQRQTANTNRWGIYVHGAYPSNYDSALVAYTPFVTGVNGIPPTVWTNFVTATGANALTGTAVLDTSPPPVDPYEEAFPDWESAGVKIPLGFSFAMSFWAVCIVATIGIKWAKELASAAS